MSKSRELFERDGASLSTVMSLRFCPFTAESGEGAVLRDPDGKEYLDLTAGWGVANIGYCHPRVTAAVSEQMKRLSFATTISVPNQKSTELAEKLGVSEQAVSKWENDLSIPDLNNQERIELMDKIWSVTSSKKA